MYFGRLITALHDKTNARVAVLIDEYDAPVTNNMDNLALAQANAKVLHDFFAALKKPTVSPCLRFTLVTGITRYALTSMDSGANHLNDISLDPDFAGICGFTLEEFGPLFGDRMGATLASLKTAGEMEPSSDPGDLGKEIFRWYDGYNWGGPTRVLNPYSILNFFQLSSFGHYWVESGRPGHLTAMIKASPLDFLEPRLESYLSEELRKSELTQPQPVPVLFHGGYLTLDKITVARGIDPAAKDAELSRHYSFRLPNHEVTSSYRLDCFKVIFGLRSKDELLARGDELRRAILARDAETVGGILGGFISAVSYHQRPTEEKTFHAFVQLIFMALGFNVVSEQPGFANRLDLRLELPNGVHAIIELKYCPDAKKLTADDKIRALAMAARDNLSIDAVNECLAEVAKEKFSRKELDQLLFGDADKNTTKIERLRLLANAALKTLPDDDIDRALAAAAKSSLPKEVQREALLEAATKAELSDAEIDDPLSKAAQEALNDIKERDYHGIVIHKAKEIIDLGLAIHGGTGRVRAIFGPGWKNVPAK
jgi:hypothetical protein